MCDVSRKNIWLYPPCQVIHHQWAVVFDIAHHSVFLPTTLGKYITLHPLQIFLHRPIQTICKLFCFVHINTKGMSPRIFNTKCYQWSWSVPESFNENALGTLLIGVTENKAKAPLLLLLHPMHKFSVSVNNKCSQFLNFWFSVNTALVTCTSYANFK